MSPFDRQLDSFMRLSILDAVAGHPGFWTGFPVPAAMKDAREELEPKGFRSVWFSLDDVQLLTALREGVASANPDGRLSKEEREDIVQTVISGFTAVGSGGIYNDIVKRCRLRGANGLCAASRILWMHGRQRALDALRRRPNGRLEEVEERSPEPLDAFDIALLGEEQPRLMEWALGVWRVAFARAPGKYEIVKMWCEDPTRTATDIAVQLGYCPNRQSGKSDCTYVASVLRNARRILRCEAAMEHGAFGEVMDQYFIYAMVQGAALAA